MVSIPMVLVLFSVLLHRAAAQSANDPARSALQRLETIDVDKILGNNRILTNYIRCFLNEGACSPEARDFKRLIPKLASTACGDCTENQRSIVKKIFMHMINNRPDDWRMLQQTYDPEGRNVKTIEEFLTS
uniref:Chemosensory protein 6 n=1 Tax=Subpsaltria yangi TaxID=1195109 RepID=A0A385IUQ4_9HEMI|nr:chemosensory protein 6 [Subpsaltria yangi]AXY87877.1 chemosensory protein 8 [Subpsaltria yangi]